ncbi:MAG: c-type cytochrome [Candidatus Marinimicrobia bacterium]|nr:c-type cytochrome [Candidatus Neomarinimicrobiota bacterium]
MKKRTIIVVAITMSLALSDLIGQELKNVQVLPYKTKKEIFPFMKNIVAKSLGVKCKFCHNIKDYSIDENPHKLVAREMMSMVNSINVRMESIQEIAQNAGMKHWDEAPVIECWVCHRGITKPEFKRP